MERSAPHVGRLGLGLLIATWFFATLFTPSTVLWRDSGEFILAGFFLDIVHPPGYPLYAQLANPFALLPVGPIAWRAHLFSGALGALFLCSLTLTTARILSFLGLHRFIAAISVLPALLLFMSPAFLRGLLSAEAYLLHAVLMLALLNLYCAYLQTTDLRLLILAGFIAGLSLGNHVSGILTFIPVTIFVLIDIRRTARAILPAFLAAVLGLGVYGYLPARSLASPPLNTGAPHSLERFVAHITNARDRLLRPSIQAIPGTNIPRESWDNRLFHAATHDLRTLSGELSIVVLLSAVIGVLFVLRMQPSFGGIILSVFGGNMLFFSGWDPDPWIISLALLAVLASVALAALLRSSHRPLVRLTVACCLIAGVALTTQSPTVILKAASVRGFSAAPAAARSLVDSLPHGAPIITEASWFIAQYLHTIEGYRADVVPIYQPSLLFPHLFAPLEINILAEHLSFTPHAELPPNAPDEQQLRNFITAVSRSGPVFFEPNLELNGRFRTIARLSSEGTTRLERDRSSSREQGYVEQTSHYLTELRAAAVSDPLFFGTDTQQYLETILTNAADLLRITGYPVDALTLIERVCSTATPRCSATIEANRALYLLDTERFHEAIDVILEAALREPQAIRRLLPNLQLALSQISPEEIEQLQRHPPYKTIIEQAGF
jgi:hypothetical protein